MNKGKTRCAARQGVGPHPTVIGFEERSSPVYCSIFGWIYRTSVRQIHPKMSWSGSPWASVIANIPQYAAPLVR